MEIEMKVFVTGVRGQLGYDVVRELEKRGIEAVGVDIQEMDITDEASVDRVIRAAAPDAVFTARRIRLWMRRRKMRSFAAG